MLDLALSQGDAELHELFGPIADRIEYSLQCAIEVSDEEPRRLAAAKAIDLLGELRDWVRLS